MQEIDEASKERMALLNNALVESIDKSNATPLEAISTLEIILNRMKRYFEISLTTEEPKGKDDGGNMEKASV